MLSYLDELVNKHNDNPWTPGPVERQIEQLCEAQERAADKAERQIRVRIRRGR